MSVAVKRQLGATSSWGVLVVEDNAAVAALHCRLIDALPDFQTVGVVSDGDAAYRALGQDR